MCYRDMASMQEQQEAPESATIILHGFGHREISLIMRAVKGALPGRDIIFAKSTPTSLKMRLANLIADVGEDHAHLKQNPPSAK